MNCCSRRTSISPLVSLAYMLQPTREHGDVEAGQARADDREDRDHEHEEGEGDHDVGQPHEH